MEGFAYLDAARSWVRDFICGYNHQYRHSRMRFVTPAQRHGRYQQARKHHPHRWSSAPQNGQPIGTLTLNPEREQPALKMAA
jgi:putative transposase